MIRKFEKQDEDRVIKIWLEASIIAHDFVAADYWKKKTEDMRTLYLPQSDTFVYQVDGGEIMGFISLVDHYIAAIFVAPASQGQGIGRQLIDYAKGSYTSLSLGVYTKNTKSIVFYQKQGFKIVGQQEEPHTGEQETIMEF